MQPGWLSGCGCFCWAFRALGAPSDLQDDPRLQGHHHTHGFIPESTSCNTKQQRNERGIAIRGDQTLLFISVRLIKVTFNLLIEVSEAASSATTNSSIKAAR